MTFENAPSSIDGALLSSALLRRAQYAELGGAEGVVQKGDLKVSQLGTPGVGIQISPGVGLLLNRYQSQINETYVVSNPGVHTVPSVEMPASNASAKSYIVAVVIGDPDFSQVGHPFMAPTDPPVGQEQTFQYVRVRLIEVSAGATSIPSAAYPYLALARIDIPASTTTIINSYITDLRSLARPRQEQQIFVSPGGTWDNSTKKVAIPSGSSYFDWGSAQFAPTVRVPSWATRAIVVCSINGVILADASVNVAGYVRAQLGSVSGAATAWDFPVGRVGTQRDNLQCAASYDVTSIAGTDAILRVEGYELVPASPTSAQKLYLQSGSQQIFDVRFFEQ